MIVSFMLYENTNATALYTYIFFLHNYSAKPIIYIFKNKKMTLKSPKTQERRADIRYILSSMIRHKAH